MYLYKMERLLCKNSLNYRAYKSQFLKIRKHKQGLRNLPIVSPQ